MLRLLFKGSEVVEPDAVRHLSFIALSPLSGGRRRREGGVGGKGHTSLDVRNDLPSGAQVIIVIGGNEVQN